MELSQFTASSPGRLTPTVGGAKAFVPAPLPRALEFTRGTWTELLRAERAIAEVTGLLRNLTRGDVHPAWLYGPLVREEAIVSSRIEGTITTARQLALFEADALAEVGASSEVAQTREVSNYLRALERGLEDLQRLPIGSRFIRGLHHCLLTNVRGSDRTPGEFRRTQNFIGSPGQDIFAARFVPPPPNEIDACMSDLEHFIHEPEADAGSPLLVRLALVHYQFEAIHPFGDGNGRVGRLLLPLMLRMHRPGAALILVSAQLERERQRYYDLLLDVSVRGAWDAWIRFFVAALASTAESEQRHVVALLELRERWHTTLAQARSSSLPLRVVDELFKRPAVSRQDVGRLLGVTPPAASKIIARLVDAGILVEATGRERGQVFIAPRLLDFGAST